MRHLLKLALACALFCVTTAAHAQPFSKSTLTTQLPQFFPDNTTNFISPALLRSWLTGAIESWQQYAGVNAQTGTTYTIVGSDYGQYVSFNNSSAVAVTLPAATAAAGFYPFSFYATNFGAGVATLTPTSGRIGGLSSLALSQDQIAMIFADGTNWQVIKIPASIINVAAASLPPITADGGQLTTQNQNTVTASTILTATGGGTMDDVTRSVGVIPGSSTPVSVNGYGSYLENNNASFSCTQGTCGVGTLFFGNAIANVAGAQVWGGSFALNDSTSCNSVSALCLLNGLELDFTIAGSETTAQGVSLELNSATDVNGNGFQVSKISTGRWQYGFVVNDGSASSAALLAGATATSGNSISSLPIQFGYRDSSGVSGSSTFQAIPNGTTVGIALVSSAGLAAKGYLGRAGTTGAYEANNFNFNWTGSCVQIYVDTSNQGCVPVGGSSTGVVQYLSGAVSISAALANGTTATTQSESDNSTNVATDAFVAGITTLGSLASIGGSPVTFSGGTIQGPSGSNFIVASQSGEALVLKGNTNTGITISSTGTLNFGQNGSGTAAKYVCTDSSNNIILQAAAC